MEAAVDSMKDNEGEQQNVTTGFLAASNANARSSRMLGGHASVTQLSYHSGIGVAAVEQERLNSLQAIIREKNRESHSYIQVIEQLRKENSSYKAKANQRPGIRSLEEMMAKMDACEKQNFSLKQQIISHKRIEAE